MYHTADNADTGFSGRSCAFPMDIMKAEEPGPSNASLDRINDSIRAAHDAIIVAVGIVAVLVANVAYVGARFTCYQHHVHEHTMPAS